MVIVSPSTAWNGVNPCSLLSSSFAGLKACPLIRSPCSRASANCRIGCARGALSHAGSLSELIVQLTTMAASPLYHAIFALMAAGLRSYSARHTHTSCSIIDFLLDSLPRHIQITSSWPTRAPMPWPSPSPSAASPFSLFASGYGSACFSCEPQAGTTGSSPSLAYALAPIPASRPALTFSLGRHLSHDCINCAT